MRLAFETVRAELGRILRTRGCPGEKADKVAHEMARNSLEGTYTHGVNRFMRLIANIDDGLIDVRAEPVRKAAFGALERYDGQRGLGIPNALFAMERAISLARDHGVGLVAMANTNHWLRAATYGRQACEAGLAGICFTNTMPNMPAWGATDARLGNNPLVMAFPGPEGPVVVDIAMSQFSYGALELAALEDRQMPIDAGYGPDGALTRDPRAVMETRRILPTGYWKGAALSFLLDVFASCISLGHSVAGISRLSGDEHGLSQVMLAIDYRKISGGEAADAILLDNLDYLLGSTPQDANTRIRYPGEKAQRVREENLRLGIPVDEGVWAQIQALG